MSSAGSQLREVGAQDRSPDSRPQMKGQRRGRRPGWGRGARSARLPPLTWVSGEPAGAGALGAKASRCFFFLPFPLPPRPFFFPFPLPLRRGGVVSGSAWGAWKEGSRQVQSVPQWRGYDILRPPVLAHDPVVLAQPGDLGSRVAPAQGHSCLGSVRGQGSLCSVLGGRGCPTPSLGASEFTPAETWSQG